MEPQEFLLARTLERIELNSDIVCQVQGKSSIGRLGLIIHTVAGYCDSGFNGTITLELFNCNKRPIKIYSGMRIAQLTFHKCQHSKIPYNKKSDSKYCGQIDTTPSKYGMNKKDIFSNIT
jgi:dCTP deaminase